MYILCNHLKTIHRIIIASVLELTKELLHCHLVVRSSWRSFTFRLSVRKLLHRSMIVTNVYTETTLERRLFAARRLIEVKYYIALRRSKSETDSTNACCAYPRIKQKQYVVSWMYGTSSPFSIYVTECTNVHTEQTECSLKNKLIISR